MKYYYLEPEVAGGFGPHTVLDDTVWPPRVSVLDYEFEDWLGSAIVTSFPCYCVTKSAGAKIVAQRLTGAVMAHMIVSKSDNLIDVFPEVELPEFEWLKIVGVAGIDDFGISADNRLVVSQPALDLLNSMGLPGADISDF